jgi:DNA-binding MarR family transcriptional regulator
LISKKRVKSDQRAVHLEITKKGLELLRIAPKPTKGLLPHSLENMKKVDLLKLSNSLDKLINEISGCDERLGTQPLPFNV